jgi:hypothetical protein
MSQLPHLNPLLLWKTNLFPGLKITRKMHKSAKNALAAFVVTWLAAGLIIWLIAGLMR